jgi:glycosyltransferase involved in cell wall biosynthesis
MKTLSVLIPMFNEASTIETVLKRLNLINWPSSVRIEILVIDDASTDTSVEICSKLINKCEINGLRLVKHEFNKGKGSAIHTGIRECNGDYIVIQDADLEYNPDEIKSLLDLALNDVADVVYGSRFIGGKPHRVLFFWHTIGNKILTFLSNANTNLNLTDMETCYKLFDAKLLKSLDLKEKRFGFEPEVTAKIARIKNVRIYEIGISYHGRTYAEGKKIGWKDGFRAIYVIFKYGKIWF